MNTSLLITTVKEKLRVINSYILPFALFFLFIVIFMLISEDGTKKSLITPAEIKDKIIIECLAAKIDNRNLARTIYHSAKIYKMDMYLLYGILRTYSDFNPHLVSKDSESEYYGLMQLDKRKFHQYSEKALLKPAFNLKLGITDYKTLLKRSGNNHIKALAVLKSGYKSKEKTYGKNHLEFIENILKERDDFKLYVDNFIKQNYDL